VRPSALAVVAIAALCLAPAALGHGSVRPTVATPRASQLLTFVVLNGRDDEIVGFRLQLPAGASVEEVVAREPTWIATSSPSRVEWRGGPIPAHTFDSFQLRVRMPDREGTASFAGTEVFPDGPGPPSRFDVVLARGAPAAEGEGGTGLREAAPVAAVALLLGAAVVALAVLRRRARLR
jgi:hypothetical protein